MSRTKEEILERRQGTCKHFNGMMNEKCKVGIAYDSVKIFHVPKGTGMSLPCIKAYQSIPCECDKAEYPSREEVEAEEAAFKVIRQNVADARQAIVAHTGGAKGVRGCITCPICGGENALRFSVAGYNGHIHASCTTDKCVSWME